ncbi:hypothetical protein FRB94_009913 [Tulasnella sp. JGI-2019a]|nr:hypothetical protein FRB94_009913 [Tulasnella sp. JGI-2019a]KAG9025856.1 hypothetical protein FRB95_009683 [Tulasnella sp. JGI-2019a]
MVASCNFAGAVADLMFNPVRPRSPASATSAIASPGPNPAESGTAKSARGPKKSSRPAYFQRAIPVAAHPRRCRAAQRRSIPVTLIFLRVIRNSIIMDLL